MNETTRRTGHEPSKQGERTMTIQSWTNSLGRALGAVLTAGVLLVGVAACDGLDPLDVDERAIVVPEDLAAAGPAGVPTFINGMVGQYHEAVDDIIRYAALLTDEMVLAGTFPTRAEVDARRILVDNASLTGEVYEPLHEARFLADTVVFEFQELMNEPEFSEVEGQLREGVALGRLYGGYSRIWLAELYCQSILTGLFPEASPLLPDDRMRDALTFLEEAEQLLAQEGFEEGRLTAVVGQARAHLWLGDYARAASLAEEVPRDFRFWAEYSNNDPDQFNEMHAFTWGNTQAIRWAVGDGTSSERGNESFAHFDEFVDLKLLRPEAPGLTAFNSSIPVNLQLLYGRPEDNVLMASGAEAILLRAEVAVRNGQTEVAEDLLNDLRSDFSTRATIVFGVEPPEAGDELEPVTLTGEMTPDLETVAAERARELWLTGDRHTTARRLRLDPTVEIDLFPPLKPDIGGGDDIAFPIVQQELDNNPNLTSGDACPAGQSPGSWR